MNFHNIFELQSKLMNKYHVIEVEVCGPLNHPVRLIHDYEFRHVHHQEHMRVMVTRILEELYEADQEPLGSAESKEEIIDALHFFTELLLYCGVKVEDVEFIMDEGDIHQFFQNNPQEPNRWDESYYDVARFLSRFTYQLKAKPWSRNPKETDINSLRMKLADAYRYMLLLVSRHMTYEECLSIYLNKHKVNTNRQDSGY